MTTAAPPDVNMFKRWYVWATPWVQVGGFVIVCVFYATTYFDKFEAYGSTLDKHGIAILEQHNQLNALNQNYAVINQKLDDMGHNIDDIKYTLAHRR